MNDLNDCRSTPTPGLEKHSLRLLPTNLTCRVTAQQLFAFLIIKNYVLHLIQRKQVNMICLDRDASREQIKRESGEE